MKRVYESLNGVELATAIAKSVTKLALQIPGLNSRLTTFPRAKVEITIRLRAFDRPETVVSDMDDFIERLVEEGIEHVSMEPSRDEEYVSIIDEGSQAADAIRRDAGIPVARPELQPTGQIVDKVDPLPAGENLDNIVQFGAPGAPAPGTNQAWSGRGRVIDPGLPTGGVDRNPEAIRPKLKGDPAATHFRIREKQ